MDSVPMFIITVLLVFRFGWKLGAHMERRAQRKAGQWTLPQFIGRTEVKVQPK